MPYRQKNHMLAQMLAHLLVYIVAYKGIEHNFNGHYVYKAIILKTSILCCISLYVSEGEAIRFFIVIYFNVIPSLIVILGSTNYGSLYIFFSCRYKYLRNYLSGPLVQGQMYHISIS